MMNAVALELREMLDQGQTERAAHGLLHLVERYLAEKILDLLPCGGEVTRFDV